MNEKVKKFGAGAILMTMFGGLANEAYSQIRVNQVNIARIQERERAVKEIVLEIKNDVEFIRRKLEEK